jgi:hypothetical protein
METVIIFGMLTFFAALVANRASKLNRNPWTWGITAWLISPLGVWIVLEICGKKEQIEELSVEENLESDNFEVDATILSNEN